MKVCMYAALAHPIVPPPPPPPKKKEMHTSLIQSCQLSENHGVGCKRQLLNWEGGAKTIVKLWYFYKAQICGSRLLWHIRNLFEI